MEMCMHMQGLVELPFLWEPGREKRRGEQRRRRRVEEEEVVHDRWTHCMGTGEGANRHWEILERIFWHSTWQKYRILLSSRAILTGKRREPCMHDQFMPG